MHSVILTMYFSNVKLHKIILEELNIRHGISHVRKSQAAFDQKASLAPAMASWNLSLIRMQIFMYLQHKYS